MKLPISIENGGLIAPYGTSLSDLYKAGINIDTLIYNTGNGACFLTSNRKMGNITNSTLGDNVNFQGDFANQNKTIINENPQIERAFNELFSFIEELEQTKKEQAKYNADELKESLNTGEINKSKKFFGFLRNSLGDISSLVTIGQFFGL